MKYFPLLYRLNTEDRYLIWITNESDRVLTDNGGFILTFKDTKSVQSYAETNDYELEREEPNRHNLDSVARWLKNTGMPVDCREVLAAWNLFSDIARSIHGDADAFARLDARFPEIYNKVFRGNNLPSMTPEGCDFDPEWSPQELTALAEILGSGLEMFQRRTRQVQ